MDRIEPYPPALRLKLPHPEIFSGINFATERDILKAKERVFDYHLNVASALKKRGSITLQRYVDLSNEMYYTVWHPEVIDSLPFATFEPLDTVVEKLQESFRNGDEFFDAYPDKNPKEEHYQLLRGSFYIYMRYVQYVVRANYTPKLGVVIEPI